MPQTQQEAPLKDAVIEQAAPSPKPPRPLPRPRPPP